MHLLPGMDVVVVQEAAQQVAAADLDGLFRQSCAELIVAQADIALQGMGEHVHAGVGGDCGGDALHQLHVQDGLVRQQAVRHQGILCVIGGIRDDAE